MKTAIIFLCFLFIEGHAEAHPSIKTAAYLLYENNPQGVLETLEAVPDTSSLKFWLVGESFRKLGELSLELHGAAAHLNVAY